jgi:hypothetical protein
MMAPIPPPGPKDPLAHLREILGQAQSHLGSSLRSWAIRHEVGVHLRFKGTQEIRVSAVGEQEPDHVLVDTFDQKDGAFTPTRTLIMARVQIPPVLEFLLKAEEVGANLSTASRDSWPTLPIFTGEATADGTSVKVTVDEFRDRLQIKISKCLLSSASKHSGEWATFGAQDIRPIALLLVQAFDAMSGQSTLGATSTMVEDTKIPF